MDRDPSTSGAGVVALAWGLALAIAGYAVLRAFEAMTAPGPNPAVMAWSAHSGFFWRIWTAGYLGGCGGFVAFLLARRDPRRLARALTPALVGAALGLALQALFFP